MFVLNQIQHLPQVFVDWFWRLVLYKVRGHRLGSSRGRPERPPARLRRLFKQSLKKALVSNSSPSLSVGTRVCEELGSLLSHDRFSSDSSSVIR